MANPGPVQQNSPHFQTVPANGYRLLGFIQGLSVAAAQDVAFNVLGTSTFVPAVVVTCNSSGTAVDVSSATVGIYTAPGAGGSAVHATAALTGQTTATFAYVRASSVANARISAATLYAHVVTTVAGGVVDLMLYGYDVQTPTP